MVAWALWPRAASALRKPEDSFEGGVWPLSPGQPGNDFAAADFESRKHLRISDGSVVILTSCIIVTVQEIDGRRVCLP